MEGNTILGTAAAEELSDSGGPNPERIGGNTISGLGGGDTLYGGAGDDSLIGGEGADSIFGGDGADSVAGGAAGDFIDLGAGNADGGGNVVVITTADVLSGGGTDQIVSFDSDGDTANPPAGDVDVLLLEGFGGPPSIDDGDPANVTVSVGGRNPVAVLDTTPGGGAVEDGIEVQIVP